MILRMGFFVFLSLCCAFGSHAFGSILSDVPYEKRMKLPLDSHCEQAILSVKGTGAVLMSAGKFFLYTPGPFYAKHDSKEDTGFAYEIKNVPAAMQVVDVYPSDTGIDSPNTSYAEVRKRVSILHLNYQTNLNLTKLFDDRAPEVERKQAAENLTKSYAWDLEDPSKPVFHLHRFLLFARPVAVTTTHDLDGAIHLCRTYHFTQLLEVLTQAKRYQPQIARAFNAYHQITGRNSPQQRSILEDHLRFLGFFYDLIVLRDRDWWTSPKYLNFFSKYPDVKPVVHQIIQTYDGEDPGPSRIHSLN